MSQSRQNLRTGSILRATLFTMQLLLLGLLIACSGDEQLPPGVSVRITPEKFEWDIRELLDDNGECIFSEDYYQDNIFTITVANANGQPIGDADLDVYLSPSNSTSSPLLADQYIFHLYDDTNSNGVVDHPQELVSGSNDEILYQTRTEEYHGTKTLIVRSNTSCGGFRATLNAFAGEGFGTAEILLTTLDDIAAP